MVDSSSDRWFPLGLGAVLVAFGATVGGLMAGAAAAVLGGLAGLAAGAWIAGRAERRIARRRAVLSRPFPDAWRDILSERYEHYERLPEDLRQRFERDLQVFLAEKRITGVGIEATEELRVLVAASAVTLTLGWPEADWDVLTEVLLYPDDFDRDYQFGGQDLAGETHAWGTVILSAPALIESFEYPDDGFHVGLHEFAHLLDMERSEFDGTPTGLTEKGRRDWAALVEAEMRRLREGKSILDDYGANDPVEFFAVAVETLFEKPRELRRRHAELYALLAEYFVQDPAAWDDQACASTSH
jgi:Mlc titration factor MtfA (ptsG expression regulator)